MIDFQEEVRRRRQIREGGGFNRGESEDEGEVEEEDGRWEQKVLFHQVDWYTNLPSGKS